MLDWLLARLFPRVSFKPLGTQEPPAPLSQALTVAYAARLPDTKTLCQMDEAVVAQWATTQSARMQAGNTTIEHIPWWYPVHPAAMAYFVERGWWAPDDIEKHVRLPMYDMASPRFGAELGTFFQHGDYTKMDTPSIAAWCHALLASFPLSLDARASFLGHTLVAIGPVDWLAHVWPICSGHAQGVELDVLFAVCGVHLPAFVALEISPILNDGLRSVTPPNTWDTLATEDTPYALAANHPHYPLHVLLESTPVWSCLGLYRLGVELKHLESAQVESYALPFGADNTVLGLGA